MRHIITVMFAVALATCAFAEEYTLTGERWLRKYSADRATPVYNVQVDAARIVKKFCDVEWKRSAVEAATLTYHDSALLNTNVTQRENYDAALFCAYHASATHVAYANAACYRIDLGTGTLPNLTSLAVNVYSDPYNANGARIVLMTNDSGKIPTDCATVRGDVTGGIKATNVAKRITVTSGGKDTWYPASTNLVFGADKLGAGGIQLKRYLLVFVLMENYSTTRGDWLEGSSFIDNEITVTTSAALPGTVADCDIVEPYATNYGLKDGHSADDPDGDGLSNYTEYLISEVFAFTNLDINAYATTNGLCDYFQKCGELYYGEMFQDHDRIDDAWERSHSTVASMYVYDPERDDDGDGWSNYAEYKAATSPEDPSDYPVPTVRMTAHFASKIANTGDLNVRAWSLSVDSNMTGSCAASWTVGKIRGTYRDIHEFSLSSESNTFGHLREGKAGFIVWQDTDGGTSGVYDPGEPFGCVKGVDVGWQGASFEVTLSEMNAITPRFSLWDSGVSDRGSTVDEMIRTMLADRLGYPDAALSSRFDDVNAENDKVNVRFVRMGVNGVYAYAVGCGMVYERTDGHIDPLLFSRTYDRNGREYICEADFLQDGEFDIDWTDLKTRVCNYIDVINAFGEVTNMTYLAVFEGGSGNEYWFRGGPYSDTNTVIRCASTTIERRFEHTKHAPVAENVNQIQRTARPTFRWSLPNEEAYAKKYGTSYTAFKIQIFEGASTNNAMVYDSGIRRAPAQDADGDFDWTANLSVGDLTSLGKVFSANSNYCWRVAMYNAKFQPGTDDKWSNVRTFSTAVNSVQEMNDANYSSIDVAVRYAGSPYVIDCAPRSVNYQDLTTTNAKIRVQAFATADFAGDPLSEAIVTDGVTNFTSAVANVRLVGLPNAGTYYLRAYIDSNGNHALDDWESWGAAESVTLSSTLATAPVVGLWIEDSDTDGDWFPDALEYVECGNFTKKDANVMSEGKTLFTAEAFNAATNRTASISTCLEGASLTIFENGSWAKSMIGWGDKTGSITWDDIRAAVNSNIVNGVSSPVNQ